MPKSLYTRQELFILRNDIPVDSLIKELKMPFKVSEGYFRFCCPECREFNTSVDPRTNLARCFRCENNYNTIDLVECVRGLDFINSVEFLKKFHDEKNKTEIPPQSHPIKKTTTTSPVSITKSLRQWYQYGKARTVLILKIRTLMIDSRMSSLISEY